MNSNELGGALEGSRVIVLWANGDGPHQYTIHHERGRVFGQSESDVTAKLIDRTKELSFVDQVWLAKG
jgi:hypothetical protein